MVLCSPFTRALQTCIIALASHPMWRRNPNISVKLLASIREKRGWASLDSQGRDAGEELLGRFTTLMEQICDGSGIPVNTPTLSNLSAEPSQLDTSDVYSDVRGSNESQNSTVFDHKGVVERAMGLWEGWLVNRIDVNDCTDRWWNTSKETDESIDTRLKEFVNFVRYTEETSIIVVGHSGFFRMFLENYAADELRDKKTSLVEDKILNCEMRGLRFNVEENVIDDVVYITKA